MKALFDEISIECSRNVTKTYSTSFSLAVKMLDEHVQNSIYAIYGFVRLADEIVDSFHNYDKEILLSEFEHDLKNSLERKISLNPILNSFQQVVHKYSIGQEMIDAFLSSMRSDLHKTIYNTVEDYNNYIYGSADVVGLMCLKVFVKGDQKTFNQLKPYAMSLGSAFQKVNFLRDIKDDNDLLDRSYFPNVNHEGLTSDAMKHIITDIEKDFDNALIGIKKLPNDVRFGVYTAYIYYTNLFMKLKKTTVEDLLTKRIRVSNPVKMGLLAKSFISYKFNLL